MNSEEEARSLKKIAQHNMEIIYQKIRDSTLLEAVTSILLA